MNKLAKLAIEAHGGLERWNRFTTLSAHLIQGGELWAVRETRNPNALWVVQQLREAWAYKQPHRFLLFDRDAKFGVDVASAVRNIGGQPTRTAFVVRGRTALLSAG